MVGSAGGSLRDREISRFIGLIIKKKIVAATKINDIRTFKKWPYINLLPFIINNRPEKSGIFAIAEIDV